MISHLKLKTFAVAALASLALPAQAAYISIDDSDPNTITITAGDFEGGFYVNGNLLTSGLGNGASLTLADGIQHAFTGSWIDLGLSGGPTTQRFFGIGNVVYSGVEATATSDGFLGSITGGFAGFDAAVPYFPFAGTMPQDGSTADFSFPYLSASFRSETVPEPGTLGLLGAGLTLLASARRKRSA